METRSEFASMGGLVDSTRFGSVLVSNGLGIQYKCPIVSLFYCIISKALSETTTFTTVLVSKSINTSLKHDFVKSHATMFEMLPKILGHAKPTRVSASMPVSASPSFRYIKLASSVP